MPAYLAELRSSSGPGRLERNGGTRTSTVLSLPRVSAGKARRSASRQSPIGARPAAAQPSWPSTL